MISILFNFHVKIIFNFFKIYYKKMFEKSILILVNDSLIKKIFIMNSTANQSCSHAVFMFNKYVKKFKKSKNSYLNLLYTHYSFFTVCNNYLISAVFIFL